MLRSVHTILVKETRAAEVTQAHIDIIQLYIGEGWHICTCTRPDGYPEEKEKKGKSACVCSCSDLGFDVGEHLVGRFQGRHNGETFEERHSVFLRENGVFSISPKAISPL